MDTLLAFICELSPEIGASSMAGRLLSGMEKSSRSTCKSRMWDPTSYYIGRKDSRPRGSWRCSIQPSPTPTCS